MTVTDPRADEATEQTDQADHAAGPWQGIGAGQGAHEDLIEVSEGYRNLVTAYERHEDDESEGVPA